MWLHRVDHLVGCTFRSSPQPENRIEMRNCRTADTDRDYHLEMVCAKKKIKLEIKFTQWRLTCVYLAPTCDIPQSPISQSWSHSLMIVPKPAAAVWMHCASCAAIFGSAFVGFVSKIGPAGSHTITREDIELGEVIWESISWSRTTFAYNQSFRFVSARSRCQLAGWCVRQSWSRTKRRCTTKSDYSSMQSISLSKCRRSLEDGAPETCSSQSRRCSPCKWCNHRDKWIGLFFGECTIFRSSILQRTVPNFQLTLSQFLRPTDVTALVQSVHNYRIPIVRVASSYSGR